MSSFWRMTTGAVALVVGLAVMGSTASAESESVSDTEAALLSFTIAPPEGFEVSTDDSAPAGLYTVKEFVALTGQSEQFGSNPAMESGRVYLQVWDAADGSRSISVLAGTSSSSEAADFVSGALAGAGSEEFDPGVKGQTGRILHVEGVTEYMVVWHQGRFGAMVISASPDPVRAEEVARNLALRQSVQITSLLGSDAKVEGANSSDNSVAYQAGRITAMVMAVCAIVGVLVFFTTRSSRRNRLQQQQWGAYPPGYVPQLPPTPAGPPTATFAPPVPPPPPSPPPAEDSPSGPPLSDGPPA